MVSLSTLVHEFQSEVRAVREGQAPPSYSALLRPLEDPQLEKCFYGGMS